MDLQSTQVCLRYIFKFQEALLAWIKHSAEQMAEQMGLLSYEEINKLCDILKCWEGKAKG